MNTIRCILTACFLAAPGRLAAQSPDSDVAASIRTGLLAECQRAQEQADPYLCKLTWITELHMPVDDDEYRAMERAAEGKPIHPDSVQFSMWKAYRERGPERRKSTAWTDGQGQWRLNSEWLSSLSAVPATFFHDRARTAKEYWHLNPHEMLYCLAASPPDRVSLAAEESSMRIESRRLRFGPLAWVLSYDMKLDSVAVHGARWQAQWSTKGVRMNVAGALRPQDGKPLAEQAHLNADPEFADALAPSIRWSFREWTQKNGFTYYAVVEGFDQQDRLLTRYSVSGAESITASQLAALIQPPDINTPDPIRGESTAKWIHDFRPGVAASRRLRPTGPVTVSLATEAPWPSRSVMTWAGWIVGVALLLIAFWLRHRRITLAQES